MWSSAFGNNVAANRREFKKVGRKKRHGQISKEME